MLSFVNMEKLSQSSSWLLLPLVSEEKKARGTQVRFLHWGPRRETRGKTGDCIGIAADLNCIKNCAEMYTEVKIPPRAGYSLGATFVLPGLVGFYVCSKSCGKGWTQACSASKQELFVCFWVFEMGFICVVLAVFELCRLG